MSDAVTMINTRHVKPGSEREFEAWLQEYVRACERQPGHLGMNIVRPTTAKPREYTVISNYDSPEHLAQWLHSDKHARWLADGRRWLADDVQTQVRTGLETWFTPASGEAIMPPPRWKMFLIAWIGAWAIVWILDIIYVPLIAPLFVGLRAMLFTAVIIGLMTFVVMPFLTTKVFSKFLYPSPSGRPV